MANLVEETFVCDSLLYGYYNYPKVPFCLVQNCRYTPDAIPTSKDNTMEPPKVTSCVPGILVHCQLLKCNLDLQYMIQGVHDTYVWRRFTNQSVLFCASPPPYAQVQRFRFQGQYANVPSKALWTWHEFHRASYSLWVMYILIRVGICMVSTG